MDNQLQVFENKEFGKLEILMIEDKPYFPATECATILGYSDPYKAVKQHTKKDGWVNCPVIDRLGREQEKRYINEGNLYRLIVRSKLPSAERFEKFVFDEVLPSIRKHGAYISEDALEAAVKSQDFAFDLFRRLIAEKGKSIALQGEIKTLTPKARYCDIILQCKNTVPVSVIAKDYGYSATKFNRLLHDLRIQYKVCGTWLLYQSLAGKGYTHSRTYYTADGLAVIHTHWTQKGRLFLYNELLRHGIVPLAEQFEEDDFELFEDFDFAFDDDSDFDFWDDFEEAL